MALPDPRIILLAKAYAYRLERGYEPQAARQYISTSFGADPSEVRSAIYYAQRAIAVGEALSRMGPQDFLSEALEGKRRPAETVGVRVQVSRYSADNPEGRPWRVNDLYIEARWDETVQDVIQRAREWFEATEQGSGPAVAWSLEFVGPTLWPGASPGLSLEG